MIATVAPASAAARAARWPARPAPMMRTSCAGMAPWSEGRVGAADHIRRGSTARGLSGHALGAAAVSARRTCSTVTTPRRTPVGVDDHQRAQAAQRLRAEQRLQRGVGAIRGARRPRRVDAARRPSARAGRRRSSSSRRSAQRRRGSGRSRRRPGTRPAVAQEELVLGARERRVGRDRDGLGVHDVGDGDAVDALGEAAPATAPLRAPEPRNQPRTTSHSPSMAPLAGDQQVDAEARSAAYGEALAERAPEKRVPRLRSPVMLPGDRAGDAARRRAGTRA